MQNTQYTICCLEYVGSVSVQTKVQLYKQHSNKIRIPVRRLDFLNNLSGSLNYLLRQSFLTLNFTGFLMNFLTLSQTTQYTDVLPHLQPKLRLASSSCYQIHSVFSGNILNTSTQVSGHLHTIILMVSSALFYQIAMDSKVFRTMLSFRKPYSILLGFSEVIIFLISLWSLPSCPDNSLLSSLVILIKVY